MYCTKCGKENKSEAKYCFSCGAQIEKENENTANIPENNNIDTVVESEEVQNSHETVGESVVGSGKKKTILVLVLLVALVSIYFMYLSNSTKTAGNMNESNPVEYVTSEQITKMHEGMSYKDFTTLVGGEGELVFDRSGVKTYEFKVKDKPDNVVRIAFDNTGLFGVVETGDDTIESVSNDDDKYIDMCKAITDEEYPDIAFQDIVEYFIKDAQWNVNYENNEASSVTLSGFAQYEGGKEVNLVFEFTYVGLTDDFAFISVTEDGKLLDFDKGNSIYNNLLYQYASENGLLGD